LSFNAGAENKALNPSGILNKEQGIGNDEGRENAQCSTINAQYAIVNGELKRETRN
jgi:hypothetical protein